MYPNAENMNAVLITKRIEIIMDIQVCPISRMNFDYEENGGKQALLANPKHQHRVSQCGEHDYGANKKWNRDYYEYQILSYFLDELRL